MASDESASCSDSDHDRLLALLDGYGLSERVQRLLALPLAGDCTRTEHGREIRGEISLQLVVDSIMNQSGLLELLSEHAQKGRVSNRLKS